MKDATPPRRWPEWVTYPIALVLCLSILERLLELRRANLRTPFLYAGDGLFYGMVIKAILRTGWYLTNDSLGAPHGQELYDFPQPDTLSYLSIKLIGLFTSNYAMAFNLFYLSTFPLTTVCALYVLRRFGVGRAPAILASLLYTFTFYHLSRGQGQGHLMLVAYYPVPLIVMVMLWVCSGDMDFAHRRPRMVASLLICVLIASTGGGYYSFFAMALLASVGLFLGVRHRSIVTPMTPLLLIGLILGVFLVNLTPSLVHRLRNGGGEAAQRAPAESELYGLKIAQLLMPVNDHRVKALADLKTTYNLAPLSTENVDASLGFIGSGGFLFLIGWLLYRKGRDETSPTAGLLDHLSLLNASAILIATIGGFGSLFAHLVSPQIRAYNRISVYVAFFSLFAVALLLDSWARRFARTRTRRIAFRLAILALIVLGVLDQTNGRHAPHYDALKAEYRSDHDFVMKIEAAMPRQAMVFQLPVQTFPEGESYDHLRAYLHSDTLRWSFGAMQGRDGGDWQEAVSTMPLTELLHTVTLAGFSGLYVDRGLYPDGGARVESEVSSLLRSGPLVSRDERLSFFTLVDYRRSLSGDVDRALHPLLLKWRAGCSPLEGSPDDNWRWCAGSGELRIDNRLPRERRAIIELTASSLDERDLRIEGMAFSDAMRVDPAGTRVSRQLTVPPGVSSIRFTSDTPAVRRPPDPRPLSFRIHNLRLKEVGP